MGGYDVIVIGGGHAGTEAAAASARLGAATLLLTHRLDTIGEMSCNPAIGGLGKGHLAREIDALDGLMGRVADRAGIQFRLLNRSKGPAVRGPRAQVDRKLYRRAMQGALAAVPGLESKAAAVEDLIAENGRVAGVVTAEGERIAAGRVVLTTGTFLRGLIHLGEESWPAGRVGEAPSIGLARTIEDLGLAMGRLKTGTPPRLDGRTIDTSGLERQPGDASPSFFSFLTRGTTTPQIECHISHTGPEGHAIIRANLDRSPMYSGRIESIGPRYCPSIEDKIHRFADRDHHQIFLEPEGLDTAELYVNGLSTSLPADVQIDFLHAVPGLENARLTRPGYAIEYDYYPPQQLTPWLELKALEGLFFAGQINGTTGYEEAAGQGAMAGINAVRRLREDEPVVLGRDAGYIGVLIDDLVTRGVDEPYRLFTSRSEYRLLLRQDNALKRLGPLAAELGLLSPAEQDTMEDRIRREEEIVAASQEATVTPDAVNSYLSSLGQAEVSEKQKVGDLVKRPRVELRELFLRSDTTLPEESDDIWTSVEVELKYAGYLAREKHAAKKLAELASFQLHQDLDYLTMKTLSTEARQKLDRVKPESLAQAGRIPGVSPSDLQNLVLEVMRRRSQAA